MIRKRGALATIVSQNLFNNLFATPAQDKFLAVPLEKRKPLNTGAGGSGNFIGLRDYKLTHEIEPNFFGMLEKTSPV